MNRPSTVVRTLRHHPVIFARALRHLFILLAIYTALLAVLGRLDNYWEWVFVPLVMTGINIGGQIKEFDDRGSTASLDTGAGGGTSLGS